MTTRFHFTLLCALCASVALAVARPLFAQETTPLRSAAAPAAAIPAPEPRADETAAAAPATAAPSTNLASRSAGPADDSRSNPSSSGREGNDVFPGYRYWMVPETSIDHWPWGPEKYLPIKSTEFKEWLETTYNRGLLQDYVDGLRFPGVVTTLSLTASVSDETLEGAGVLVTEKFDLDSAASGDVRLATPPLQAFRLATSYPDAGADELEDTLATYPDGLFYLPDSDGKTRRFRWSQRGKHDASGRLYYDFNFASEVRAELLLDVPVSDVVVAHGALVTSVAEETPAHDASATDSDPAAATAASSASASAAAPAATRRWRVSFAERSQARVFIVSADEASGASRALGYRQESSYRVSLSGTEATARFEIEGFPAQQNETTIVLEAPLELHTLEFAGSPNVRRLGASVDADGTTRVRVRVPSVVVNDGAGDLRVTAFCPSWEGNRRLPTIRLESDELVWHESTTRVTVAAPLAVSEVETIDSAQARDASRSRPEGQTSLTFKLFNPDAGVRLTLRRDYRPPVFDSATDCYFAANEISARVSLFLKFSSSDWNRLVVPLAPGWDVDSVAGAASDSVAWTRETDPDDSSRRLLRLSFKSPPDPEQPARVTFAARYVAPIEERVPVDRLCPLDVHNSLRGAHALAVRADSSSQVRLTTAAGRPFVPMKATRDFVFNESYLREALPPQAGGVRLWLGDQTVDAYALLETVRSNYSVSFSARCVLGDDSLRESWRLHCVPSSGKRVESVVFFVTPAASDVSDVASNLTWTWSTSTDPDRRYEAKRLSAADARAYHAPENADAFEIRLATSRSVPFDVNLFCEIPATRDIQTPLVFFPDSDGESVEIVLESTSDVLFKTSEVALVESTVPSAESNSSWRLKKAFRYDPTAIFDVADDSVAANLILADTVQAAEDADGERSAETGSDEAEPQAGVEQRVAATPQLILTLLDRGGAASLSGAGETEEGDVLPLNSLCWFENHDSYYQTDGTVDHCVTFYLENRGRNAVRLLFTRNVKRRRDAAAESDAESLYSVVVPDEAVDDPDFFTGALDPNYDWTCVKTGDVYASVAAVWVDDDRAQWSLWKRVDDDPETERYVVDVRLLAKRRYVRVELDFSERVGSRLVGGRRIRPIDFRCDAPTLSGVWNAWFPPQFQTRRAYFQRSAAPSGAVRFFSDVFNRFMLPNPEDPELEATARRVASRLGDSFALRLAVGEARRADSSAAIAQEDGTPAASDSASASADSSALGDAKGAANAEEKPKPDAAGTAASLDALRFDAPTWGDVFGSPAMASSLFAPAAEAVHAEDAGGFVVDTPFGKLEGVRRPVTLLIDRYALLCAGVSPNAPLPNVEANNPVERANRMMAEAGVVLTLVGPELAVVTTPEALSRQFPVETTPLCGPAFCRPASRHGASRMRAELLNSESRRFLTPEVWRALAESTSPWNADGFDSADGTAVQGWTYTSTPIGRTDEGVYIVNRYMLVALEFVGFVGFVVLFWRRSTARPQILLGTMGVCVAVLCPAQYEVASFTLGVFLGAFCLFALRLVGVFMPRRAPGALLLRKVPTEQERERRAARAEKRAEKRRAKTRAKNRRGKAAVNANAEPDRDVPRRRVSESELDESVSSEGYVDFARMSPEELRYIQGPQSPASPNASGNDPHDAAGDPARNSLPPRDGTTTMKTLLTILIASLALLVAASAVPRADARQSGVPQNAASASAPATADRQPAATSGQGSAPSTNAPSASAIGGSGASVIPGASRQETAVPGDPTAARTPNDAANADAQSRDNEDAYVEPYRVFVPTDAERNPSGDFYWIDSNFYNQIRADLKDRPRKRSWRVVDALYEGVVNYNSFSATTSLFSLKATYTVVTDEPNVTIYLPAIQLAAEGGARFDRQIVPVSYSENGDELCVEAQGEPGVHTLELSIVPPQFFETTSSLTIPILPVASARLRFDVSLDAPLLDAPGALGKITRSPRVFAAELGPIDQLVVTKAAVAERSERNVLDAEQYFLMRPRASQTDLRAVFRCQTLGDKVQTIEIDCDPAYAYSGYCRCDAEEIESVDAPTLRNRTMRVSFKRPISGPFNLNVDFVARNFSGVGRLPFPNVRTRGARVVKNWLALAPDAAVECSSLPGAAGLATPFQTAWGTLDSKLDAVYDLDALAEDAVVDVRLARVPPAVVETISDVFLPAFTETTFDVALDAVSDLFRLQLDAPDAFVVDKIELHDAIGASLETPRYDLTQDGLALEFEAPLRGKYSLRIVGRTRRKIDEPGFLPMMRVRDAACSERYVRVYCSPNVCLVWLDLPEGWNPLTPEYFAELGEEPTDVSPVAVYSVDVAPDDELLDPDAAAVSDASDAGPLPEAPVADAPALALVADDVAHDADPSPAPLEISEAPAPVDGVVDPLVVVHMNAPVIEGVERRFLYPVFGADSEAPVAWKGAYELRFQTTNGRLDQVYVVADDLFTLDPLPVNSRFTVTETTAPSGVKAYLFKPARPIFADGETVDLFFSATFSAGVAGVCLPRFQTLSSSVYEDYSKVVRLALIASEVGGAPVDWTTQNMVDTNDDRINERRKREELVEQIPTGLRSLASFMTSADADADYRLPVVVDQAFRTNKFRFKSYLRGDDASARMSSSSDRLRVSLARYSFFVNESREVFGAAVFMIRPGANKECVIVAPAGYHVLEARVNGSRRLVERLGNAPKGASYDPAIASDSDALDDFDVAETDGADADDDGKVPTRWSVELGGSPYVKRLEISFQATGQRSTSAAVFNSLRRRSERFDVDFLRVEGAETNRRLWTCAFEDFDSESGGARWVVSQRSFASPDDVKPTKVVSRECVPTLVEQAGAALCRIGLEDVSSLLNAYESDSATLSGSRGDDLKRMRERWASAWRESAASMAAFLVNSKQNGGAATALSEQLMRAIAVVNNGEFLSPDQVDSNFPIPNWTPSRISDVQRVRERVFSDMKNDVELDSVAVASNTQSLWMLNAGSYARCVFGSTDEDVASVEIIAAPKPFDFLASPYAAAIFLLMATAAILQLLDPRSPAKGLRSVIHGAFVLIWSACFFLFGWTLAALVGAFLLATGPFAVSEIRRRWLAGADENHDHAAAPAQDGPDGDESEDDVDAPRVMLDTRRETVADELTTTELLGGDSGAFPKLGVEGDDSARARETSYEFDLADNVSQFVSHNRLGGGRADGDDDSDEPDVID